MSAAAMSAHCSCSAHEGCCRAHRSIRDQPPHPPIHRVEIPEQQWEPSNAASNGDQPPPPYIDPRSSYAITPIHLGFEHHLSLQHLDCVRRRLEEKPTPQLVPELSAKGNIARSDGTRIEWNSYVYFERGRFLQRQQALYLRKDGMAKRMDNFISCPHHSIKIDGPTFEFQHDRLCAKTLIVNNPPRCDMHFGGTEWTSLHGNYLQMNVCQICHCDAECIIALEHANLFVWYTCYKDLGAGDASNPDAK